MKCAIKTEPVCDLFSIIPSAPCHNTRTNVCLSCGFRYAFAPSTMYHGPYGSFQANLVSNRNVDRFGCRTCFQCLCASVPNINIQKQIYKYVPLPELLQPC